MAIVQNFKYLLVISLLLFTTFVEAEALASKTYVDPTINIETNSCITPDKPCKKISDALSKTKPGGTIILLHADDEDEKSLKCINSYNLDEKLVISKSVNIIAASNLTQKPCFNANESTDSKAIEVNSGGKDVNVVVKMKGLRFIGEGGYVGVEFFKGSELTIDKCDFQHLNYGIVLTTGNFISLRNSTINATTGVWLKLNQNLKSVSIKNIRFVKNISAVVFEQIGSAEIKNIKTIN